MAVDLNFKRNSDSIPWGFRLTGGADLDLPITVIKVTEKSIAEDAGMKVGDMLVRVGDNPTAGLTHLQVHDLIKDVGNTFAAAVIRGEHPAQVTETEETIDSQTTEDGISKSVQINIKANVVDTTEIVVENGEIIEQDIRINGTVISDEEQNITINKENKSETAENVEIQSTETKDEMSKIIESFTQPPECIKDSEVLKVINEEKKSSTEENMKIEKRWTTFLQKPDRAKPKTKPKANEEPKKPGEAKENYYEEHVLLTRLMSIVQEPPYRVIIQKQKKKRDEEKARSAEASQETTPIPAEMLNETPILETEEEEKEETQREEGGAGEEEEQTTEVCEQAEDPAVSEMELSLEEQLAAIQKQLLALSQLPAAIQQTLDVVTQQLTKIVGPVNDPNTEENDTEDHEEDTLDSQFDTDEFRTGTGDLETLEEVSESAFERDSQQGDDNAEHEVQEREEDFDRPESELEMLQVTPEPEEDLNLTPEEREAKRLERQKMDKQQKIAHWNDIWPWGDRLGRKIYRDANTHLVPSKAVNTKKINFLKYQPPPKTLDHLKHSEVYRLVHDMDQPTRGVGARGGKAMAEEDYYAQAHQEGQIKG